MKTIIKVNKLCLFIQICFITIIFFSSTARAQVWTATIVIPPSTIKPDCHTYTGCGVVVMKRHYYRKCYVPRPCVRHCYCRPQPSF